MGEPRQRRPDGAPGGTDARDRVTGPAAELDEHLLAACCVASGAGYAVARAARGREEPLKRRRIREGGDEPLRFEWAGGAACCVAPRAVDVEDALPPRGLLRQGSRVPGAAAQDRGCDRQEEQCGEGPTQHSGSVVATMKAQRR